VRWRTGPDSVPAASKRSPTGQQQSWAEYARAGPGHPLISATTGLEGGELQVTKAPAPISVFPFRFGDRIGAGE